MERRTSMCRECPFNEKRESGKLGDDIMKVVTDRIASGEEWVCHLTCGGGGQITGKTKLCAGVFMKFKKGDQFKVSGNVYKGRTFTVAGVDKKAKDTEYSVKCTDEKGDTFFFSQVNFEYYGDKVKRIGGKK